MEEHLRSKEALVANIARDHLSIESFVDELLEARGLLETAVFQDLFLVKLFIFFQQVFCHIAVVLLDFLCNFLNVASR